MFKFKSWALETQASMERKFQMSRNLSLFSESNLLLPAPWNLKILAFLMKTPRLQPSPLAPLGLSVWPALLNHPCPHTNTSNLSQPKTPASNSTPSQAVAPFLCPSLERDALKRQRALTASNPPPFSLKSTSISLFINTSPKLLLSRSQMTSSLTSSAVKLLFSFSFRIS